MRRYSIALFIAATLSWLALVRTDGFSPLLIQGALLSGTAEAPSPEVRKILEQRFHYLAKGRQSFVFESEDGKYVIKFFNQKYFQMPWYGFLVEKEKLKRATRRHYYENSYRIAYEEMGDEILYLHLSNSQPLPTLRFVDRASSHYELDLSQIPFVLQKKGIPLYKALDEMVQKEGLEGLYRGIDGFVEAVALRIFKQIADGDHNVEDNWGYVDGHIFHLDPGRLYYEELTDPKRLQTEWDRATHNFYKWLINKYPEGANYLKCKINNIIYDNVNIRSEIYVSDPI